MHESKYGEIYTFEIALVPAGGSDEYQTNPTIASGDFKIYRDGGSAETLDNTPTVIDAGIVVTIVLSAAEMQCKRWVVTVVDAAGAEWMSDVFQGTSEGSTMTEEIFDLIESQRGARTGIGAIFYVDPVNGDTHANGNRGGKHDPYLSVQDCHDNAVTTSRHDVIILVPGQASAVTVLDEQVTISKRYVFIRGPGRDVLWKSTSNGDVITVTGDGCELSGFQLETHTVGVGRGIYCNGADFLRVRHLWINQTRGSGILVNNSDHAQIHHTVFEGAGQSGAGHGIEVAQGGGSSIHTVIHDCHISDTDGDGIKLGNTCDDAVIVDNSIHQSTGIGINITAGAVDATLLCNRLGNNAGGDIVDNGTTTMNLGNDPTVQADLAAVLVDTANMQPKLGTPAADLAADIAAVPTVGEIDTELTSTHGSGAWASVVGGGAFSIVIATAEADTTPIADVVASIYTDAARSALFVTVNTGVTGSATAFGMVAAKYYWAASKAGTLFASGSFTISASDTQTLTGSLLVPTPAASPDNCTVYGDLEDIGGNHQQKIVTGFSLGDEVISEVVMTTDRVSATANSVGRWELPLKQGGNAQINIPDTRKSGVYEIPATSTAKFTDLVKVSD